MRKRRGAALSDMEQRWFREQVNPLLANQQLPARARRAALGATLGIRAAVEAEVRAELAPYDHLYL